MPKDRYTHTHTHMTSSISMATSMQIHRIPRHVMQRGTSRGLHTLMTTSNEKPYNAQIEKPSRAMRMKSENIEPKTKCLNINN